MIISTVLLVTVVATLLLTRGTIHNEPHDKDKTDVHYPTTQHPLQPTRIWGEIKAPYPTGAWWLNIMFGDIGQDATGATSECASCVCCGRV